MRSNHKYNSAEDHLMLNAGRLLSGIVKIVVLAIVLFTVYEQFLK